MRDFLLLIYRVTGVCFGVCAVAFMSIPSVSEWKKIAGVACAIAGMFFTLAMYFAKRVEGQEEMHLVKRELEHYPPGVGEHDHGDVDHHAD